MNPVDHLESLHCSEEHSRSSASYDSVCGVNSEPGDRKRWRMALMMALEPEMALELLRLRLRMGLGLLREGRLLVRERLLQEGRLQ